MADTEPGQPVGQGEAPPPDSTGAAAYKIVVRTSDEFGSGTDANVYIILHGEGGNTDRIALDNDDNNFETGKTDTFVRQAPHVGKLTAVTIGHDNKGMGAAWKLQDVEVTDPVTDAPTTFPCNEWLATGKGDGKIERTLAAAVSGGSAAAEPPPPPPPAAAEPPPPPPESEPTPPPPPAAEPTPPPEREPTPPPPPAAEPPPPEREPTPPPPPPPPEPAPEPTPPPAAREPTPPPPPPADLAPYTIIVRTADEFGSGTDANVYVILQGKKGTTERILLDNADNNFETGKADNFQRQAAYVGELTGLTIGHDNKGMGAAWKLQDVEVTDTRTGKTYTFECNQWLATGKGDGLIERSLTPKAAAPPPPPKPAPAPAPEPTPPPAPKAAAAKAAASTSPAAASVPLVAYKIAVRTCEEVGSGTDANVHAVLHGEKGSTDKLRLDNKGNNFEAGSVDRFEVKAPYVGRLTGLTIGHDDKGMGAAWQLSDVKVTDPRTFEVYTFECNDWLAKNKGDGAIERSLAPKPKEEKKKKEEAKPAKPLEGEWVTPKGRTMTTEELMAALARMNVTFDFEKYASYSDAIMERLSSQRRVISPDAIAAMVDRLYVPKDNSDRAGDEEAMHSLKLVFNEDGKEAFEPVKVVSTAEQVEAMSALYERCLATEKKSREDLAAKWIKPVGVMRKFKQ